MQGGWLPRSKYTHTHTYSRRSTVIWSARVFPTNNAQMPLSHSSNFAAKIFLFLRTITEQGGRGGVAIYSRWIYDFLGRLFCVVGIMCATIHTHKHINSSILPKQPSPHWKKREVIVQRNSLLWGECGIRPYILPHHPLYWNFWGGNFSPGGSNREP